MPRLPPARSANPHHHRHVLNPRGEPHIYLILCKKNYNSTREHQHTDVQAKPSERNRWVSRVGHERTETLDKTETACVPGFLGWALKLLGALRARGCVRDEGRFGVRDGWSLRIRSQKFRGLHPLHHSLGVRNGYTLADRFRRWERARKGRGPFEFEVRFSPPGHLHPVPSGIEEL